MANKKMGCPVVMPELTDDESANAKDRRRKVPALTGRPESDMVITIRAAKGWTNKQLGSKVGVSEATVRAWAAGQRRPSGSALILLAQLAGKHKPA